MPDAAARRRFAVDVRSTWPTGRQSLFLVLESDNMIGACACSRPADNGSVALERLAARVKQRNAP